MILEQLGVHMQKGEPLTLTLYAKINSTEIIDLDKKHRTLKFLE